MPYLTVSHNAISHHLTSLAPQPLPSQRMDAVCPGQNVLTSSFATRGRGLQQRPCRGPFRHPFEMEKRADSQTAIPHPYHRRTRNDREQPETTGGRKRLLRLGFGRFSLVSGHPRNGWCLITRRSRVQIPPPLLKSPGQRNAGQGFYRVMRFFYRPFYRPFSVGSP